MRIELQTSRAGDVRLLSSGARARRQLMLAAAAASLLLCAVTAASLPWSADGGAAAPSRTRLAPQPQTGTYGPQPLSASLGALAVVGIFPFVFFGLFWIFIGDNAVVVDRERGRLDVIFAHPARGIERRSIPFLDIAAIERISDGANGWTIRARLRDGESVDVLPRLAEPSHLAAIRRAMGIGV